MGVTSPLCMPFENLVVKVRELESVHGFISFFCLFAGM